MKSGQRTGVDQNSAYAACQSRKLLSLISPPVRMTSRKKIELKEKMFEQVTRRNAPA